MPARGINFEFNTASPAVGFKRLHIFPRGFTRPRNRAVDSLLRNKNTPSQAKLLTELPVFLGITFRVLQRPVEVIEKNLERSRRDSGFQNRADK